MTKTPEELTKEYLKISMFFIGIIMTNNGLTADPSAEMK